MHTTTTTTTTAAATTAATLLLCWGLDPYNLMSKSDCKLTCYLLSSLLPCGRVYILSYHPSCLLVVCHFSACSSSDKIKMITDDTNQFSALSTFACCLQWFAQQYNVQLQPLHSLLNKNHVKKNVFKYEFLLLLPSTDLLSSEDAASASVQLLI